ncbi:MAG TPA: Fe-S cluster assembly protein NifU, partial [Syntrophobacteraceae bacterium]|nr:Fe-S cluster assembly protein NifU [Syntrophobacteraceae bacterium]
KDAKFKTFGCASAIASASALTEMIKGMTIEEAEKVTNQDIAEYLGGLPQEKMHCSVMGREALEAAIAYYKGTPEKAVDGQIVCECFGVTDREIERAIRENHLKTLEEVTNYTKAGGGCGSCHDSIQELLDRVRLEMESRPASKPRLSNIQKIRMIEETIDREIRPSLKLDGGDIALIDVIGDRVIVATRGACASCQAANMTLKHFVESKLRELVWPELVVEEESQ